MTLPRPPSPFSASVPSPRTPILGPNLPLPARRTPQRSRALLAARTIRDGAALYDRAVHLPRLVPIDPATARADAPSDTARVCQVLAKALRSERTRGRAGHWTYDLNRHIGLLQAFRAERARLARETMPRRRPSADPAPPPAAARTGGS